MRPIEYIALYMLMFALGCSSEKKDDPMLATDSSEETGLDACSIIINKCSRCHKQGGGAPFPLTTFDEIRKRGKLIEKVTGSKYMPPWLPGKTGHAFKDDISLSPLEISKIKEWVNSGMMNESSMVVGGKSNDNLEWALGEPDLVLEMASPFEMPAESEDRYRHFVLPTGLGVDRYVKGFDFKPGNMVMVHHAFIKIDRTNSSRRQDEADPAFGFDGMDNRNNAAMPEGHFVSWQQGRKPKLTEEGVSWVLPAGSDIVFQLHLKSTGRKEALQSKIGLYFTNAGPSKYLKKVNLTRRDFWIPANDQAFKISESFTLVAPARLRAVMPHAHYLGKTIKADIRYPDGKMENILHIPSWDPAWQSEYVFENPVPMPAGATLVGEITYDNSSANFRNPNPQPKDVPYGPQIQDEMFEVAFQLMVDEKAQFDRISKDIDVYNKRILLNATKFKIKQDPGNADEWCFLGQVYLSDQDFEKAQESFVKSINLNPNNPEPYYYLGIYYRFKKDLARAEHYFQKTLRLDKNNAKAHGNLGLLYLAKKDYSRSKACFERALEINPQDQLARRNIQMLETRGF